MQKIGEMWAMRDKFDQEGSEKPRKLTLFGRDYKLPESRRLRILVGTLLIMGGILGFLPVLGFWMIPLGVLVLAQDIKAVRRFRRRLVVKFGKWNAGRDKTSK